MRLKSVTLLISLIFVFVLSLPVIATEGASVPSGLAEKLQEIQNILFVIACAVCVIKAVQIGIQYMLTGANDKSKAKESILPWIVGAIVCGGYVAISNWVVGIIQGAGGGGDVLNPGDPTQVTNALATQILSILMYVAYAVAFGMIIWIGIKYMMGAAGDKAKVKQTFVPYIIGAIIVGMAAQLTTYFMGIMAG